MRCIRCLKPLTRPALSILTRRGYYAYYGPKCARLAGLLAPKARKAVRTRNAHDSAEADPRQMALELAA